MSANLLYHKVLGKGSPVVILHGLIGSSDNWRTFAKKMEEDFQIILCDLRNHGRSFHDSHWNYQVMAEDIFHLMDHLSIQQFSLIGHSLGGKVALKMLQLDDTRIQKLAVLDIANKTYQSAHNHLFMAMNELPLQTIHTRKEADDYMKKFESNYSIRQVLLKNLHRSPEGFTWKINISAIHNNYTHILEAIPLEPNIETPVCFIKGALSDYIDDQDLENIRLTFLNAEIYIIENSGHWVHVDAPEELFLILQRFLN